MNKITFKGVELIVVVKFTQTYADTLKNAGIEFEANDFETGIFYTGDITNAGWEEIIYKSPKSNETIYAYSFTTVSVDDMVNTTFLAKEKLTVEFIKELDKNIDSLI